MKKNTWIVLGLVAVLGLIYLITKQDKVSVGIKRLELPTFSQDQVNRIEIKGKNPIVLLKKEGLWLLELNEGEQKLLVNADQSNVKAMLEASMQVQHSYYVTQMEDKYKDLGLDAESVTLLSLHDGDKTVWSLELGNSADSAGRYAKLPDSKDVFVVKAPFWQLIRNSAVDWRDRTIISLTEDDLVALSIDRMNNGILSLTKKAGDSAWSFAEDQQLPKAFRVNSSALSSLVRSVIDLRAGGFNDKAIDLGIPNIKIIAREKMNKEYTFLIYPAGQDKYWLKQTDKSQVFEISKFNIDHFMKSLDEMRDFSLFKLDNSSIIKISLADKGGRVVAEKTADQWKILEPKKLPEAFEFDEKIPDELIAIVSNLTALRLAQPNKDQPIDSSWLKVPLFELSDAQAKLTKVFTTKSKKAGEHLIKGNVDDEIYVISSDKLNMLNKGISAFKKEAFELPPIDERTKGFESLPVDIQRKLLDATKNKAGKGNL